MVFAVSNMVAYAPESISRAQNTLVKALYLKRIRDLLQDDPKKVISDLEELRQSLCRVQNFRTLVVANLKNLKRPVRAWEPLENGHNSDHSLQPLNRLTERLSPAGQHPGKVAYLVPVPAIDSSYSLHTARGPNSYDHPQIPALMVAISYLTAPEGPFWCAIRGTGLAYDSGLRRSIESGLLSFWVYSSPEASKAFAAGRKVVEDYISGATPFDPPALEGAISIIALSLVDQQASMIAAAQESFTNQVIRKVPKDYSAQILKAVRDVSEDQIKQALKEFVLPVFQPDKSILVVTCATGEQEVSQH